MKTNHFICKVQDSINSYNTPEGEYCFGGEKVSEFIDMTEKLVRF